MASRQGVRIPESDYGRLGALVNLPEQKVQELRQAIGSAPLTMSMRELVPFVTARVSLDSSEVADILEIISTLYAVRSDRGLPIDDFVDIICDAMEDAGNSELLPIDNNWEPFKRNLTALLELDGAIGIASKRSYLTVQHERILHDVQVITDLRPVFKADPSEGVAAAIVFHTLMLTYHEGYHLYEFHVAIDDDDLLLIRQVLDRAEIKSGALRTMLKDTPVLVLQEDQ